LHLSTRVSLNRFSLHKHTTCSAPARRPPKGTK
jgi:hypothetical protein